MPQDIQSYFRKLAKMCFCDLEETREKMGLRKKPRELVLRVEPLNQPIFVQDEAVSDTRPLYQGRGYI